MSGVRTAAASNGGNGGGNGRPENVGILAADVYFPSTFVAQEDLEAANGVSAGKYTIGLGQEAMAFTGDREDINSVCLTVVAQLLEKYDIPKDRVGRLEVGTETLIDKSKSTKTVLMSLFEGSGNDDIEGVTTINACYGGTAALLNAVAWVESSGWDGRYAIVVAADIAVYAEGPARPTGGCGAVAVLIGPDAPLVIDMKTRASHACDVWDFFKPDMSSEYPKVNGQLSQTCYLRALDSCYDRLAAKKTAQRVTGAEKEGGGEAGGADDGDELERRPFVLNDVEHVLCHSPYNKLVQKSFARMAFSDARRLRADGKPLGVEGQEEALGKWLDVPAEETYDDRELEKALKAFAGVSTEAYRSKVEPGCRLSKQIGNTYTASVFANIVCLVCARGAALEGETALVFSYGSGAVATMYELHFRDTNTTSTTSAATPTPFTVARIAETVDLAARLADRERLPPAELDAALAARSHSHSLASSSSTVPHAGGGGGDGSPAFVPQFPLDRLFPGVFYLEAIGPDGVRAYARRPNDAERVNGEGRTLAPSLVQKEKEACVEAEISTTATTASGTEPSNNGDVEEEEGEAAAAAVVAVAPRSRAGSGAAVGGAPSSDIGITLGGTAKDPSPATAAKLSPPPMGESSSRVGPAARLSDFLPRVVVTGVACGLPGQDKVFERDNLARLLEGQNCLEGLSAGSMAALVEKNVVQLKRQGGGQPPLRIPISKASQTIKLAATLGGLDMSLYGVSPSIAATMDKAVKVAVVAGLEALKDAGIVSGEGEEGWMLPGHMRDTTGVMYASSFPALDAAIGEVMRFLRSRCITRAKKGQLVAALRERIVAASPDGKVAAEDEEALQGLEKAMVTKSTMDLPSLASAREEEPIHYEFDRKFLFRVLLLGNAQLAQMVGARGPNMQTNAACAGSTLAVAMAQDMIQIGRCERMVVIAGDDASGEALLPWIGNGFRALGASSIAAEASEAALPFDARRNGMLLGAGGIGMVLETECAAARRHCEAVGIRASRPPPANGNNGRPVKARLLETQISNSAYHGASMDKHHIAIELERFLGAIQRNWGISRDAIAEHGVYFSHETCTHATPTASCAFNEITALRQCFGEELLARLVIINTKGFTGHPMGVSFEDVAAVEALHCGVIPPTANNPTVDPALGKLRLSAGGAYPAKYAMRFAAGFGSQVAFALYSTVDAVEPSA
ncbi:unnamed protein product [Scytosiphon promiscuus]